MRALRASLRRLRGFFFHRHTESELSAEIQSHLQLHIDDNIRAGMTPDEARRAALVKFGPVEAIKEQYRERSSLPVLESFRRDAAFGFRALRRQPGFALAAITTLALGIGANAAVFSVVDAVLLRPLPYPAPDRIVRIKGPSIQSFIQFSQDGGDRSISAEIQESRAFSALGFYTAGAVNMGGEPAERLGAAEVTPDFFRVLGVPARIGRTFTAADVRSSKRLAVISDRLWRERLEANPAIVGKPLLLDGMLFDVMGVMPRGIDFPEASRMWVPASGPTQIGGRVPGFVVVARLGEGVRVPDALGEMIRRSGLTGQRASQVQIIPLRPMLVGAVRPVVLLVWTAAGLVLLVACINTANLLLARVASREREFAVRRAIGASRAQLVRQVAAESLVLALLGALTALPAAFWTLESIRVLLPSTLHGVERIALDGRIVAATGGLAVLTAMLFGLGPALSVRRRTAADILRAVGATPVDRFWSRFRSVLVIGEVAVALVLLSGAVTLVGTVRSINAVDTGVRGERAVAVELSLPRSTYGSPARRRQFFSKLEPALRRLPGVEAAGLTNELPGRRVGLFAEDVQLRDQPAPPTHQGGVGVTASPGYFAAAGIDLIAGRYFTEDDTNAGAPVIIVSEGYARAIDVQPRDLIGRSGAVNRGLDRLAWAEIVGVVRDVRMRGPEGEFDTAVYSPLDVNTGGWAPTHVVIRASGDPTALIPSIRTAVAQLDATVPLYNIQTFDDIRDARLADRRFAMTMMVGFAALGFALSIIGLYSVISYLVNIRTREIGIRLAIGASHSRIRRQVLGNGLAHAALGILLGGGVVAASFRVVASRVPGLGAPDPAIISGVAMVIAAVAVLATWIPAARATRIDPALTLRAE